MAEDKRKIFVYRKREEEHEILKYETVKKDHTWVYGMICFFREVAHKMFPLSNEQNDATGHGHNIRVYFVISSEFRRDIINKRL